MQFLIYVYALDTHMIEARTSACGSFMEDAGALETTSKHLRNAKERV